MNESDGRSTSPVTAIRRRWGVATTGVVILGLALPFLARVSFANPGDTRWVMQYFKPGVAAILFLEAFNLIPVAAAAASTMLFRRFHLWLIPVAAGYAYVGWWHARLDLASDAQAAIGLVIIPVRSLPYFGGGALLAMLSGFCFDRWNRGKPQQRSVP